MLNRLQIAIVILFLVAVGIFFFFFANELRTSPFEKKCTFDNPIFVNGDDSGRIWIIDRGGKRVISTGVTDEVMYTIEGNRLGKYRFDFAEECVPIPNGGVYILCRDVDPDTGVTSTEKILFVNDRGKPIQMIAGKKYDASQNMETLIGRGRMGSMHLQGSDILWYGFFPDGIWEFRLIVGKSVPVASKVSDLLSSDYLIDGIVPLGSGGYLVSNRLDGKLYKYPAPKSEQARLFALSGNVLTGRISSLDSDSVLTCDTAGKRIVSIDAETGKSFEFIGEAAFERNSILSSPPYFETFSITPQGSVLTVYGNGIAIVNPDGTINDYRRIAPYMVQERIKRYVFWISLILYILFLLIFVIMLFQGGKSGKKLLAPVMILVVTLVVIVGFALIVIPALKNAEINLQKNLENRVLSTTKVISLENGTEQLLNPINPQTEPKQDVKQDTKQKKKQDTKTKQETDTRPVLSGKLPTPVVEMREDLAQLRAGNGYPYENISIFRIDGGILNAVYSSNGTLVYSAPYFPQGETERLIARGAAGEHIVSTFVSDGEERVTAVSPVIGKDGAVSGIVIGDVNAEPAYRSLYRKYIMIGIEWFALLVVLIFSIVLVLAGPLRTAGAFARVVRKTAEGVPFETVPVRGNNEISVLAREFNALSIALGKKTATYEHMVRGYRRFIPEQALRLLGRNSALWESADWSQLSESAILDASILVLSIDFPENTTDSIAEFNGKMSLIGPIIRQNGGFIPRYDGCPVCAYFTESAVDAFLAAQVLIRESEKNGIQGVMLLNGRIRAAIIGEAERFELAIFSAYSDSLGVFSKLVKTFDVKLLVGEDTESGDSIIPSLASVVVDIGAFRNLGCIHLVGKTGNLALHEFVERDGNDGQKLDDEYSAAFSKGIKKFEAQRFGEAEKAFKKVIELNSHDRAAALYRTMSAENEGKHFENWDGALRVNPR